ncbi:MAG: hypothetical protein HN826_09445, partial [Methylococcales bacterium]|nr:hypothetical protein [Methylococcales bacterium]
SLPLNHDTHEDNEEKNSWPSWEHDALTGKYSANGLFFTMKCMKTMKKKLQYLHALHGENKKTPIIKKLCFSDTLKISIF